MGPVEEKLRRLLRDGARLSRGEVKRHLGTLGVVLLDRYLGRGLVEQGEDGRLYLVQRATPARAVADLQARERRAEQERAAAQRAELAAAQARREQDRREQLARLYAARTPEARAALIQESRIVALAERLLPKIRSAANAPRVLRVELPVLAQLFGLEFDTTT